MEVKYNCYKYINDVMNIISQAKKYFKENNIDQWQDGYPNEISICNDIDLNNSYVLIDDDKILGTMYFRIGDDITYKVIDGHWLTNGSYAVIHRIVVDSEYKGHSLAGIMLDYAIKQCQENNIHSIRIDTHKDNLSMQRFLNKHGFIACGTIYLENGDPRIAFEKIIE